MLTIHSGPLEISFSVATPWTTLGSEHRSAHLVLSFDVWNIWLYSLLFIQNKLGEGWWCWVISLFFLYAKFKKISQNALTKNSNSL